MACLGAISGVARNDREEDYPKRQLLSENARKLPGA